MDEFSLIDVFFKKQALPHEGLVYGMGDDAACLDIPPGKELLISTDTLVDKVHFLSHWDPFDIAYRAVMVAVSDMAAMAAEPCWLMQALTLPGFDKPWLTRFSEGLHTALKLCKTSLIGGDTTHGPLSITLTVLGLAAKGTAVRRSTASAGDLIWVSGELGAAAQAVNLLQDKDIDSTDFSILLDKLKRPKPRLDLRNILLQYATAAIDISDGLSADLHHICLASGVGAALDLRKIPLHPLLKIYAKDKAMSLVLGGGDDYELCFTTKEKDYDCVKKACEALNCSCYPIGYIEATKGLRAIGLDGQCTELSPTGYTHF